MWVPKTHTRTDFILGSTIRKTVLGTGQVRGWGWKEEWVVCILYYREEWVTRRAKLLGILSYEKEMI